MTYAEEHAPKGFRTTAQGLLPTSLGGIGAAVGGYAGGVLFGSIGAKGMYLVFGIFIVLVLVVASLLRHLLSPERT